MSSALKRREYSFDILKFVAIAIIVLHHYQQISGAHFAHGVNWYHGAFYWGFLVELFFIISGYFCFAAIRRIKAGQTFLQFYAGKYLRFLPMLALCGIAYLIARYSYETVAGGSERIPFTLWDVCASLTGFERWISADLMVNNPMWYVSVLLLCFVVFYMVTRRCSIPNLPLAYAAIVALGLVMRAVCTMYDLCLPFVNVSIARGFICYFIGLELALLIDRFPFLSDRKMLAISTTVLVVFVAVYALYPGHVYESNRDPLYFMLVFVVYPGVVFILKNPVVQQVFASPRLSFLGGAAYNMYVWHAPLIYLYLTTAVLFGLNAERQVAMYMFLVLCFIVGVLSNRFVDTPLAGRLKSVSANLGCGSSSPSC